MNGIQVERLLRLIDANVATSRSEVVAYLREHSDVVARQLLDHDVAIIPTSSGPVEISKRIVEEAVA